MHDFVGLYRNNWLMSYNTVSKSAMSLRILTNISSVC